MVSVDEIRSILRKHGFDLLGVVHFKKGDNIYFGKGKGHAVIHLNCKLENLSIESARQLV